MQTGLPRLHHPLFEIEGFERVSQDRFLLAIDPPPNVLAKAEAVHWLKEAGAAEGLGPGNVILRSRHRIGLALATAGCGLSMTSSASITAYEPAKIWKNGTFGAAAARSTWSRRASWRATRSPSILRR